MKPQPKSFITQFSQLSKAWQSWTERPYVSPGYKFSYIQELKDICAMIAKLTLQHRTQKYSMLSNYLNGVDSQGLTAWLWWAIQTRGSGETHMWWL